LDTASSAARATCDGWNTNRASLVNDLSTSERAFLYSSETRSSFASWEVNSLDAFFLFFSLE